jgi:hypothetical protein
MARYLESRVASESFMQQEKSPIQGVYLLMQMSPNTELTLGTYAV